jgi:large subunit ribosomal protein L25
MSESLVSTTRTEFGKGAARRLRREGQIPVVIYTGGSAPIHAAFNEHDLVQSLRKNRHWVEAVVEGKEVILTPKEVQRDVIRRVVEHIDFAIVTLDEAKAIAQAAEVAAQEAERRAEAALKAAADKAAARAAKLAAQNAAAAAKGKK